MLNVSIYQRRLYEIRQVLQSIGADFAVLTPSPGYQYLTGSAYQMQERLVALIITPDDEPSIIAPAFEVSDHENTTWIKHFIPWAEDEDPYKILASHFGEKRDSSFALFDAKMPVGVYWSIEKAVGGFRKVESLSPYMDSMRLVKSSEEIMFMKQAGHIIDEAVTKAFASAYVGVTESELVQVVRTEIARLGGSQTFATVQFGEKSALPHAESGSEKLRSGDIVLMDCGCSAAGYNTDMTRAGVVGEASAEQEKVYSTVLLALESAVDMIKPGMTCGTADGVARRIIEEAGYGDYFTHRLGHGIGLEVHEPPFIVRGNAMQLKPGMTHSIEPGIYMEGKFGIRIEDLAAVSQEGLDILTFTPRDLFVIHE
jgi:Xaa-Pro dipeptidase